MIAAADRIAQLSMPEPNSGCWIWLGSTKTNNRGMIYGSVTVGSRKDGQPTRRTTSAHRFSFACLVGAIPDGIYVCHRCDTPLCVNPNHLFLGTAKDNADDRDRKGRLVPAPNTHGEDHPSAKLSDDDVQAIRASSLSSRAIAKQYGVNDRYVRQLRARIWRNSPPMGGQNG